MGLQPCGTHFNMNKLKFLTNFDFDFFLIFLFLPVFSLEFLIRKPLEEREKQLQTIKFKNDSKTITQ